MRTPFSHASVSPLGHERPSGIVGRIRSPAGAGSSRTCWIVRQHTDLIRSAHGTKPIIEFERRLLTRNKPFVRSVAKVRQWRNRDLRILACDVCYQDAANLSSTAEMRRFADWQSWAASGLAASGLGYSIADLHAGASIVLSDPRPSLGRRPATPQKRCEQDDIPRNGQG